MPGSSPSRTSRYAVDRLTPIRRAACSMDKVCASSLWCFLVLSTATNEKALNQIYISPFHEVNSPDATYAVQVLQKEIL
jgi:hypothetical protein